MNGTVSQLITLVAFGNKFLEDKQQPENFYPGSDFFQFCNKVNFNEPKKKFLSSEYKLVELYAVPCDWYEGLQKGGCKRLQLVNTESGEKRAQEHKLAGFVGGGARWYIQARYQDYSDMWMSNWKVTDKNAPDRRIWSVEYIRTHHHIRFTAEDADLSVARADLAKVLKDIEDFARSTKRDHWADLFKKAGITLREGSFHPKIKNRVLPNGFYSEEAERTLAASGICDVFGGMGSWNDEVFETDEEDNAYNELSARLYSSMNNAIVASVNSARK